MRRSDRDHVSAVLVPDLKHDPILADRDRSDAGLVRLVLLAGVRTAAQIRTHCVPQLVPSRRRSEILSGDTQPAGPLRVYK